MIRCSSSSPAHQTRALRRRETSVISSAVPVTGRCPSRAGRLAARYSHLSYRLKPRSTSRSITSALDRLVLHPRRDRSTSIMTSAQPGGSMKTVVKLMVVLVTSRPPITRGSTLSSARASKTNGSVDDRTTRRTARDGTGAKRRRSAAAAAAAGKKRRARKTKNPNVVHLAFAPAAASKPQTADLARMFRAKRGHECPYARRGDRFTREIAASPARAPRSHPMKSRILGSRKSADRARKVSGGREEKTGAGSNARESARRARARGGTALSSCSVEEEVVLWIGMRTGSAYSQTASSVVVLARRGAETRTPRADRGEVSARTKKKTKKNSRVAFRRRFQAAPHRGSGSKPAPRDEPV